MSTDRSDQECRGCLYFLTKSTIGGLCRRFPPVPYGRRVDPDSGNELPEQTFPYMKKSGWCGEWNPKD